MSSTIDSRIVTMKFQNSDFASKISATIGQLGKLRQSLALKGANEGIQDVQQAANKFNFSGMTNGVDSVTKKFSALSIVGITALADITKKAVDSGIAVAKSFTTGPISAGFANYETQIGAVQTILANTGLKGASGLGQVNDALAQLNTYANQTIYNFSEMAKNIGTFTAAGVDLKTSTESIKGIANLAALSGSSSEQASTAMYQLSQALSAGTFKLQDYNSVVNAGLGGKVFQTAIFNAAKAAGTLKGVGVNETFDQWTKAGNSFRGSLQKGFVTTKVLSSALQSFTGDETAQQLKKQGYTDAEIKQIQEIGKTATDAATKIKTFTQLKDALKEEVATAYAAIFKTIFGDINQAQALFSPLHTIIENGLTTPLYNFNKLLQAASKLGARTNFLDGFKNAYKGLLNVTAAVKQAYREIFPKATAQSIEQFSLRFKEFTATLHLHAGAFYEVKRIAAGVFSVLDIGKTIIRDAAQGLKAVFDTFGHGTGSGILAAAANLGDFLVKLDQAVKLGGRTYFVYNELGFALHNIKQSLSGLGDTLKGIFSGDKTKSTHDFGVAVDSVQHRLHPLKTLASDISQAIQRLANKFAVAGAYIRTELGKLGNAIGQALGPGSYSKILDTVNTGLLGGIVLLLKKFVSGGLGGIHVDAGGGLFGTLKETLEGVNQTLESMQQNLRAKTLLAIAGAIGILAGALLILSLIPSKKLTIALAAMTAAFLELEGGLVVLDKFTSKFGAAKLPALAAAMVLIGAAMLEVAVAVRVLSSLRPGQLATGLGGLAAGLGIMIGALKLIEVGGVKSNLLAASTMVILAEALIVLAGAVTLFGSINFETLGKGLLGIAGTLGVLIIGLRAMPKGILLQAIALDAIAVAINAIGIAILAIGSIKTETLIKGLEGIGAALFIIGVAMRAFPSNLVLQAAGLVAIGFALNEIAVALKILGSGSATSIAKGLISLGGALLILVVALNAMDGALPGAAALLIAAGALAILTPVLVTLGSLSYDTIIKGFVALAGLFAIIGGAGLLLAPVVPVLLGIAAAIVLVGAGFALFGAGILAAAAGLALIVGLGAALVTSLAGILKTFISSVPGAVQAFGTGIVLLAGAIAKGAPEFFHAFIAIIGSILGAIIKEAPKVASAFLSLLHAGLHAIIKGAPEIIEAGYHLIISFISAIARNVGGIVHAVATFIANFLDALGRNIGRVIQAGVNFIISFINGVTNAINQNSAKVGKAAGDLGVAIAKGMAKGIASAAGEVAKAAIHMATGALGAAAKRLHINSPSKEFMKLGGSVGEGFALGIDNGGDDVNSSASSMANGALSHVKKALAKAVDLAIPIDASQPTIAPVIDLDAFRKGAAEIPDILSGATVSPTVSMGQAATVSNITQATRASIAEAANKANQPTQITQKLELNQTNTSPVALNEIEIYRRTNNQLSQAQAMLDKLSVPKTG